VSDFPLGQPIRLGFTTFSDPDGTVPADPSEVVYTIHLPDGTVESYTWADDEITRAGLGDFYLDYVPATAGHYELRQVATGLVETTRTDAFDVLESFSQVISVDDIRRAALNKTLPNDDREIQRMLTAALAEYEEHVGPLTSGSLVRYYGGAFPRNITDVVVTDADGNEVTFGSSNYIASPYLYWNEPLRIMGHGLSGLTPELFITYTAGSLPANHRELIIADVAGYFESTQRSDGAGQAGFPGEGGFEAAYAATPQVLFPRIRALGKSVARSAIA
jgi:hypothetical protein